MGFNFGLVRVSNDGHVERDNFDNPQHAPTCVPNKGGGCLCAFRFDCFRHAGDRDFFSALAAGAIIAKTDEVEYAVRPADFARLREQAATVERNSERFLYLLDLLEEDPTLYVTSS